jgi:hypothetical protein
MSVWAGGCGLLVYVPGVVARVLSLAGFRPEGAAGAAAGEGDGDEGQADVEEDGILGPMAVIAACDIFKAAWAYPDLRDTFRSLVNSMLMPAIVSHLERWVLGAGSGWVCCPWLPTRVRMGLFTAGVGWGTFLGWGGGLGGGGGAGWGRGRTYPRGHQPLPHWAYGLRCHRGWMWCLPICSSSDADNARSSAFLSALASICSTDAAGRVDVGWGSRWWWWCWWRVVCGVVAMLVCVCERLRQSLRVGLLSASRLLPPPPSHMRLAALISAVSSPRLCRAWLCNLVSSSASLRGPSFHALGTILEQSATRLNDSGP